MKIKTENAGPAAVVHFSGAADVAAVEAIRKELASAMESAGNRVVCDLSGVNFICSDALGAFIGAYRRACEGGGYLRILKPQKRVADILKTTQLDRLFRVYQDLEGATAD